MGNRGGGVVLDANATNNIVMRNTIAFNAADAAVRGAGIEVIDGGSVGNVIDANSIFSNTGLGIDLGNDAVTLNTTDGPHVGPNDLQNFPVLTSVTTTARQHGRRRRTLNSTPVHRVHHSVLQQQQPLSLPGYGSGKELTSAS